MVERIPGAGPWPTADEVAAARERLAAADSVDAAAVRALAAAVNQLAAEHADCRCTGCQTCLYLADALAHAEAWERPDAPNDVYTTKRTLWGQRLRAAVPTPGDPPC